MEDNYYNIEGFIRMICVEEIEKYFPSIAKNKVQGKKPPKNLITLKEYCNLLGVSRVTAYKYKKEGHVKMQKIKGRTWVLRDSIKFIVDDKEVFPYAIKNNFDDQL